MNEKLRSALLRTLSAFRDVALLEAVAEDIRKEATEELLHTLSVDNLVTEKGEVAELLVGQNSLLYVTRNTVHFPHQKRWVLDDIEDDRIELRWVKNNDGGWER